MRKNALLSFIFLLGISIVTSSCGKTVQEEYDELQKSTTESMSKLLGEVPSKPTYDINSSLLSLLNDYESKINGLYQRAQKNEADILMLDSIAKPITDYNEYTELVSALTKKNEEIIEGISNKYWTIIPPQETAQKVQIDSNLIIRFNKNELTFAAYKNTFPFVIREGILMLKQKKGKETEYAQIFLNLQDSTLTLTNLQGDKMSYRPASEKELMVGEWRIKSSQNYRWTISRDHKLTWKNSLGSDYEASLDGNTIHAYDTTSGGGITFYFYDTYKFNVEKDEWTLTVSTYRIGSVTNPCKPPYLPYVRVKNGGPANINILFGLPQSEGDIDDGDIDALIKAYEKAVDDYVDNIKNYKGDKIEAISNSLPQFEKIQTLTDKLEGKMDQLTPSQLQVFNRVYKKLLQVAM